MTSQHPHRQIMSTMPFLKFNTPGRHTHSHHDYRRAHDHGIPSAGRLLAQNCSMPVDPDSSWDMVVGTEASGTFGAFEEAYVALLAVAPVASKAVESPGKEAVEAAAAAAAYSQLELAVVAYTLEVLDIVGIVDTAVVAGNLAAAEQEAKVPAIQSGVAVEELDTHRDQGAAVVLGSLDMAAALVEAVEMQG